MKKPNVTSPLALAALAFWLCLTLGLNRLRGDNTPQSLFDAVAGSIGPAWVAAALFALLVTMLSTERRDAGLRAPEPWKSLWPVWPPLLHSLLLVAWAGG